MTRPRFWAALFVWCLALALPLAAQDDETETAPPADDIDSLFDDEPDALFEEPLPEETPEEEEPLVVDVLNRSGFTFEVDYRFIAGYYPGWQETPWNKKEHEFDQAYPDGTAKTGDYTTHLFAGKMESDFSVDFRISPTLRVHQMFQLDFPDYLLDVREFFADYNLADVAFFRVGKHEVSWGISPNFPYANLPGMIPSEENRLPILRADGTAEVDSSGKIIRKEPGDPYAIKVDIPIGIGGLQLLTLSRPGFIEDPNSPELKEFGYGLKYNLAFRWADIDIGSFYHNKMPFRSFMAVKSTLPSDTEIYTECLFATYPDDYYQANPTKKNIPENWDERRWSFNIGLANEFFGRTLRLYLEYFYNGEGESHWLKPENSFQQEEVTPFVYGHNGALGISFQPGGGPFRLLTQCLYNYDEETAQLVPGIRINPVSNLNIYLAVPMALGSRAGTYYTTNADERNRPFSIVLAVSFEGSYRLSYYD